MEHRTLLLKLSQGRRGKSVLQPSKFPNTRPSLLATLGEEAGSEAAWREFFARYAPPIYRVARLRGLSDPDADDVVQQVMVSISSHISDFKYDRNRGRFRQWVRTITENRIRQDARRKDLPVSDNAEVNGCVDDRPGIDEVWKQEWEIQDILWCLDYVAHDISPKRMEAFKLYALEGMPAGEVAKRLEMSVGHVYVTRHLVLNMIRKKFEDLEAGE